MDRGDEPDASGGEPELGHREVVGERVPVEGVARREHPHEGDERGEAEHERRERGGPFREDATRTVPEEEDEPHDREEADDADAPPEPSRQEAEGQRDPTQQAEAEDAVQAQPGGRILVRGPATEEPAAEPGRAERDEKGDERAHRLSLAAEPRRPASRSSFP